VAGPATGTLVRQSIAAGQKLGQALVRGVQSVSWSGLATGMVASLQPVANTARAVFARIGEYGRALGPLLVGATRLPDDQASFGTGGLWDRVVSNVGRVRPAAIARAFRDPRRGVRYVVAYNNNPAYGIGGTVGVPGIGADDRVLDLFALREIAAPGGGFGVSLAPGDGRLYAVGSAKALDAVRNEILKNRIAIERDLLELEIRVAGKMGADTAAAKQALAEVDVLAAAPESLPQALEKALSGLDAVASANLAGPHHATVLAPLERARAALGRVNAIMNGRMAGTLPGMTATSRLAAPTAPAAASACATSAWPIPVR